VAVAKASQRAGWEVPLVLATSVDSPGAEQARHALEAGVDRLLVVGGDGTIRLVAGVVATAEPELAKTPIGMVPVGAANLVARNLGLHSQRIDEAVRLALTGAPHPLSVGWVSCQIDGVWVDETPMLVVAGMGRDAQAIASTHPWLKRHAGWLAYAEAGGRHALRSSLPMSLCLDDAPCVDIDAWSVLAAALPRLPMGIVAFPDAHPGADALQVLHVAVRNPMQWGPVAVKGLAHTSGDVAALRYATARTVRVRPSEPSPVQIDGDLIENVEQMCVRLQTKAIQVVGVT